MENMQPTTVHTTWPLLRTRTEPHWPPERPDDEPRPGTNTTLRPSRSQRDPKTTRSNINPVSLPTPSRTHDCPSEETHLINCTTGPASSPLSLSHRHRFDCQSYHWPSHLRHLPLRPRLCLTRPKAIFRNRVSGVL